MPEVTHRDYGMIESQFEPDEVSIESVMTRMSEHREFLSGSDRYEVVDFLDSHLMAELVEVAREDSSLGIMSKFEAMGIGDMSLRTSLRTVTSPHD